MDALGYEIHCARAGKGQRLCSHANHLYDITLQEQTVKQQSEEEPSPQRKQLKSNASSGVFFIF